MSFALNRRHFLRQSWRLGMGLVALGVGASSCSSQTPERVTKRAPGAKPNIIFILADDLGFGELGCYGQTQIQTPHLDRMAQEGTRFTQFYAGAPVCAPSRVSLLTGLHTGHAAIRGNKSRPESVSEGGIPSLPAAEVTVAEHLQNTGYKTGLIGKWGLAEGKWDRTLSVQDPGLPHLQGFDEFFGHRTHKEAHIQFPNHLWRGETREPLAANAGDARQVYANDLFADHALDFVKRHREEPFFLFWNPTVPHSRLQVPDLGPYAATDWPRPLQNYAAMITRLDGQVGRLLELLRELQLDENTLVIFSSDNGPHQEGGARPAFFDSNGPLRGVKRDLYEGGIRVPFMVRWPGTVSAGKTSDFPAYFPDFLPTAAQIAGFTPPAGDGLSLWPVLRGTAISSDRFLYWEANEPAWKQALRWKQWKAIRPAVGAPLELYDLAADVAEARDVAAAHPEVVAQIERFLQTARTPSRDYPTHLRVLKKQRRARPRNEKPVG